jgi:signal transduction histidine kinase/CheY-like chemotaxis protein
VTNLVPLADEFPGKDVAVLRSLIGLMALPALWTGKGEKTILQLMTDAVASVVPLAVIYARVVVPLRPDRVAMLRLGNKALDEQVPAAWQDYLHACNGQTIRTARVQSPIGLLNVVRFHMGAANHGESIWFASPDAQFPTLHQTALLHAAVTLATTGLNTARLDVERAAANRRKDEFLAMLGHELRNPLAPLVTTLELIRLRGPDPLATEHALMSRQVAHLSRLVDDLLDVTRITGDKVELKAEVFDIGDVVQDAIQSGADLMTQRGHVLTVESGDLHALVKGDPERIRQVFANLLSNAAKYTQPGGRIGLVASRDGGRIVISVSDNGSGIAADLLPKVFNLFEQGPITIDRARGGMGIGLALVKTLVELHQGTVTAESEGSGKGSTFTVRLPLFMPPLPGAQPPPEDKAIRVMIVDDNLDALDTLGMLLSMHGFDVAMASTPEEAIQKFAGFEADAYVLDIGLPGMDGYQLAAELRRRRAGSCAAAQFIALTGYGQAGDKTLALAAGFHRHLTKPVDIDVLLQALRDGPDGTAPPQQPEPEPLVLS